MDTYETVCERRGFGTPITKKTPLKKKEGEEEQNALFLPIVDDYPENTLIVGTVGSGKSVLSRNMIRHGKYKSAVYLHVIQKREMNPEQQKEWRDVCKSNFNKIKKVWFHVVESSQALGAKIDVLNSITKETTGVVDSNKRNTLRTIYLFDDLQEHCLKCTQYLDLITSGSHLSIATISCFHSTPIKGNSQWNKIVDNFNLIVAFSDTPESRKIFMSEVQCFSKQKNALVQKLKEVTSGEHQHFALFKKSPAKLRSKIDDLNEQIVYVPHFSNGVPDYNYTCQYDQQWSTFTDYKFKRLPDCKNVYQIESASTLKKSKGKPVEEKEEIAPVEEDETIVYEPPPKKSFHSKHEQDEYRRRRYNFESDDSSDFSLSDSDG